ncbi:MAG: hypothetical protein K0U45_03275 [Alphaproteobacteria bacterium]|nr:hypothetical protein [Alphaproteobacteria bacterium]
MKYKKLNETLDIGSVGELIDKTTQQLFDETVRNRQAEAFANIVALLEKHPQPLTLFWLLLVGYFKLFNRHFVKGRKIDWQTDVTWLNSIIPSKHLFSFVLEEIIASCYAFNGDLNNATKYYCRVYYGYMCLNPDILKIKMDEIHARQDWLQHMVLSMETSDYDHPTIDVPDLKIPAQLRDDYIPNTPLFHAYGDANYIKNYAQNYVQSIKAISPDYFVFIAIGNPDDECYAFMEKLQKSEKHVYFAVDTIPEQFAVPQYWATYCACRRFLSAEHILQAFDNPYLLITDLDFQFNHEYKKRVAYGEDASITYTCNKDETFNPRNVIPAGHVFLRKNDIALQFIRQVSLFIRQKMAEENGFYWYLDQFALLHVFHQMELAQNPECKNIGDCALQYDMTPDDKKTGEVKQQKFKDMNSVTVRLNEEKLNKHINGE